MDTFDVSTLPHRDPATAEAIRRVMVAAYEVEAGILGVDDFVPLYRTAENIAATDALFLGISLGGTPVAVAEVEAPEPARVHVGSLVVLPSHFRRGLATALVRHILSTNPDRAVTVSTGSRNEPAIRLYEAHGFREDRRWSTPDGIPMVTLRRNVPLQT
jgi:ribosomal protein S18 acetylase RimI-like enzyme